MQRWWRLSQAPAGIFGTIVGASVLASTEDDTPLSDVAWTVVVTLVVYWLAERWSELLGSHLRGEQLTLRRILAAFGRGWPMVQASYTPLLVMLIAWSVGASNTAAVNLALAATVVLLVVFGATGGRRAAFGRWGIVASAVFSGLLGMVMILLKAFLH